MAWDWIEKGTKRLQELGGEYKQHHALVERLVALEPAAAQEEMTRAWQAMDDRARAGVKLTLAGLTLSQQAAPSSAEAKRRLERLKALHALVDQANPSAPAGARAGSTEAAFTAGAARVTNTLADVAERARPKGGAVHRVRAQGHRAARAGRGGGGEVGHHRAAEGRRAAEERRFQSRDGGARHAIRSCRRRFPRIPRPRDRGSVRGAQDPARPVVRYVAPPRQRRHARLRVCVLRPAAGRCGCITTPAGGTRRS